MFDSGIDRRGFLTVIGSALALGACSSIPTPKMGEGPPNVSMKAAMRLGPAPIKGPEAKFSFTQINGAPATHVNTFAKALDAEASARNLTLVQDGDPSATYLVKGYLSAIGDKKGTLLVYVWDVTDVNGKRLHRVAGQEPAGGSSSDPWSGIDAAAVANAASRTIDDLVTWVS